MDYVYILIMLLAKTALADYYYPDISDYESNYNPTVGEIYNDKDFDYSASGRIVGGEVTSISEFPSMLYMKILYTSSWGACGGVIISSRWALSAAHCFPWVKGPNEDFVKVLFHAGSSSSTETVSVHEAIAYVVYEGYHRELNVSMNDIALFMVEPEFPLDGVYISAARLPEPGRFVPLPEQVGTVVGFGRLNEYGKLPKFLQKVDLVITDKEFCRKNYKRVESIIDDDVICTTGVDRFKGFCDGDSGGPLFVNDELVGIVSWSGRPCGHPKKPSIFTRISSYRNWIRKKTGL